MVEICVSLAVLVLAAALVHALYISAARGTSMSVEASDALRSVLTASEFLRTDLGEMTLQKLSDLVIAKEGRELAFSVPKRLETDLYMCDWTVVKYELERLPGATGVHRLVRSVGDQPTPLASCLLKDLRVRYVPPKGVPVPAEPIYAQEGMSPFQAYLEITLVGLGSAAARQSYTASLMHPLTFARPPAPYKLLVAEP